jgi:hypothetical protein
VLEGELRGFAREVGGPSFAHEGSARIEGEKVAAERAVDRVDEAVAGGAIVDGDGRYDGEGDRRVRTNARRTQKAEPSRFAAQGGDLTCEGERR